MRSAFPIALLFVCLLVVPFAVGQETAPVLVERVDPSEDLAADVDAPALAQFRLFNLNPQDDFYVSISVDGPGSWNAKVQPNRFFLEPRNATTVDVEFVPEDAPEAAAEFTIVFSLVHGRTGAVTKVTETVVVESSAPPRVFGLFPNMLPAPLDNAYGTFLMEMSFWIGIGVASILVGDAIVRIATARASNAVTHEILHKLRAPIFYFIFFLGLARSFAILPRNPVTSAITKILFAVSVGVFGLYVLYRILDAVLLYYQREVAPRTQTALDDVLVPLVRKVGIVVLYVVGIVVVLRNLGWDPTLIFAGAGIAGLVIAFAAQDTFSNLFSGVFLLLDRPFKEGDDIQLETGEIVRVEKIGLRTTRLYHPRHHESITIPNNQLATKRVINLAGPDKHYWMMVNIGAAYETPTQKVREVLEDVAREHPKVLKEDPWAPIVLFSNFGESSLDFILRFAVEDFRERFLIASEVRHLIKKKFDENGIEIPFPQRTLWLKEVPEELQVQVPVQPGAGETAAPDGTSTSSNG